MSQGGRAQSRPYTPAHMDAPRVAEARSDGFDGLHAEAKAALGGSANALRVIRERYRTAYLAELARWHDQRNGAEAATGDASSELGFHQQELSKLDLAQRTLENTWLFLERGDASLLAESGEPPTPGEFQMRIVEAQELERSRLAQELHDGPAQAIANAIFQVEYIDRVLDQDERLARTELRFLRELLQRELGDVRSFISQLRPPVLDDLGLDGALADAASAAATLIGIPIRTKLDAPAVMLADSAQTVVLRVAQEALQNVRKHAGAGSAEVTTRLDGAAWVLEVRDDGRGFDISAAAARGRRNFGLQFMRERAELIGAEFDVRSRPEGGTVVRLAIPTGGEDS